MISKTQISSSGCENGPVALTPLRAEDPQEIAGYPLLGRLGAGGMGVVYLGEARPRADGSPVQQVAVKVVRGELADDEGFRARFRREVAAARRVSGECVVAVLDADPEAPTPYMVSEYVRGPDLAVTGGAVRSAGRTPPTRLRRGPRAGAHSIHSVGLVHRDLKPANVLCAQRGLKVIDFGIASAADGASLTGPASWSVPPVGCLPSRSMVRRSCR